MGRTLSNLWGVVWNSLRQVPSAHITCRSFSLLATASRSTSFTFASCWHCYQSQRRWYSFPQLRRECISAWFVGRPYSLVVLRRKGCPILKSGQLFCFACCWNFPFELMRVARTHTHTHAKQLFYTRMFLLTFFWFEFGYLSRGMCIKFHFCPASVRNLPHKFKLIFSNCFFLSMFIA